VAALRRVPQEHWQYLNFTGIGQLAARGVQRSGALTNNSGPTATPAGISPAPTTITSTEEITSAGASATHDSASPAGGAAEGDGNFAWRALNTKDAQSVGEGAGISAKAPDGEWTLGEHVANGSKRSSWANDPWIATTRDRSIAEAFDSGNGIVKIDLSRVPSTQAEAWRIYPRVPMPEGKPYYYSIWTQEVSVYQFIPQDAIVEGP